jgi:hypothetical protein
VNPVNKMKGYLILVSASAGSVLLSMLGLMGVQALVGSGALLTTLTPKYSIVSTAAATPAPLSTPAIATAVPTLPSSPATAAPTPAPATPQPAVAIKRVVSDEEDGVGEDD